MSVNKRIVLEVTYPLHFLFKVHKLDETIEKIVKRKSIGSGGGLGQRDLTFEFKNVIAAAHASSRIVRANIMCGKKKIPLKTNLTEFEGN